MLVNTAQKTAQTEVDPNPLNDQSSVSLNAVTTADLEVTKAVSNAAPSVGEAVTFTVKATNLGPSPATGVVVNDPLPAGLQFVSATPSQGSYDARTGAWTVGDLAATQSAVLSLTALVMQEGDFTNTATRAAANEPDPNPVNDSASASVTASRMADLSVTKTDGFDTVIAGTPDTYTITVTNGGPTDVTGAGVTDTFPAAFTGVTWTCTPAAGSSCGTAAGSGDIVTTVDLPAGGSVTFTATGTVAPTAAGTLTNTATVTPPADTPDPAPANNSATDTTAIAAAADLRVVKTGPAAVTAGTNVVFTVAVTNAGPSSASNVVVSDPTPPGLVFQSNTGACTTAFPCSLGTLGPGATATITSTYLVPSSYTAPDPIVNQASVMSATTDPAAGNNTAEAMVDLSAPVAALAVAKTDGKTTIVPSTATTYTITVQNQGPSDVAGVQVTDPVPAALGSVTWTCSATGGGSCAAGERNGLDQHDGLAPGRCDGDLLAHGDGGGGRHRSAGQHGDGAEPVGVRGAVERLGHRHQRADPDCKPRDHQDGPARGGARQRSRLHDRGDERGAVGRGPCGGGRPDAARSRLRDERGGLRLGLPVRLRAAAPG